MPAFKLLAGQGQSLRQLAIVIRVKQRKLTVVHLLIDGVQLANELNDGILFLRSRLITFGGVYIAQSCKVEREGNDGNSLLIKGGCFWKASLSSPYPSHCSERPVIAGKGCECSLFCLLSRSHLSKLKVLFTQHELCPCNIFGR